MESFFKYITPVIYWLLILIWAYIFIFYSKKIKTINTKDKLLQLLLIVLAIDAFRSLFESVYFGLWYTSLSGIIPISLFNYLAQPQIVFFPKMFNLITAFLILTILIKKWLSSEIIQKKKVNDIVEKQTSEIIEINKNLIKAKERAEESEKKYKYLIENQGEGVGIVDLNENLLFVNPAAEKLFGFASGKLVGKNLSDFFDIEQLELIKEQTKKRVLKESNTYELVLTRKDKQVRDILITATPELDDNGNTISTLGIFRDITKQKKAEKALKINERKLIESNKAKDKFFSIISHDLKSPFNTMMGFSELLVNKFDKYDVPKQKKFLGILNQDIHKTYNLLENLLLWSRAQSGTIDFDPKKENLYLLISETISLLHLSAKNKTIKIINQIPEDIYVEADKNMLLTILRNLMSNAIKFTTKGGKIKVNAYQKIKENHKNYIEISIKDSGVGIAKENQASLFKIDENISTHGTDDETGTGLGLILCKEFAEKHGGDIWVKSELGKGSEFIFSLPSR